MFTELKIQDKASRLTKEAGQQYEEGVTLYNAFKQALGAQDKARTLRLAVILDNWQNTLKEAQKADFAALLVIRGLIDKESMLGKAILTFNGRISKF